MYLLTEYENHLPESLPMTIPIILGYFSAEDIPAIQINKHSKWQKGDTFQCHFEKGVNVVFFGVLVVVQDTDLKLKNSLQP